MLGICVTLFPRNSINHWCISRYETERLGRENSFGGEDGLALALGLAMYPLFGDPASCDCLAVSTGKATSDPSSSMGSYIRRIVAMHPKSIVSPHGGNSKLCARKGLF
jgi:hypothetical protein